MLVRLRVERTSYIHTNRTESVDWGYLILFLQSYLQYLCSLSLSHKCTGTKNVIVTKLQASRAQNTFFKRQQSIVQTKQQHLLPSTKEKYLICSEKQRPKTTKQLQNILCLLTQQFQLLLVSKGNNLLYKIIVIDRINIILVVGKSFQIALTHQIGCEK